MAIDPTYWLLLPVGVAIAVAYTSTGISGANFWVPVFILWLGLDPRTAFWLALVTMLFGSASGLVRHRRRGTIDRRSALRLLAVSGPAAVVGSLAAPAVPAGALSVLFGLFAVLYGGLLLHRALGRRPPAASLSDEPSAIWPAVGGLLTGLISVGLGAVLLPRMLASRRFAHHAGAIGTSLLAVFLTSFAAAIARLRGEFVAELGRSLPEILGLMVFVVPAVLVGGQIGPTVAWRLDRRAMSIYAGSLLVAIGILMLGRILVAAR